MRVQQDMNQMTQEVPEKKKSGKAKWLIGLLLVVIIALVGATGYMYWEFRQAKIEIDKALNPAEMQQATLDKILNDLRSIVSNLPDEEPSVASIIDVEKLREQNPEFYRDAKDGYKLVVYTDRAIIFDDINKKVVNMIPLQQDPNQQAQQEEQQAQQEDQSPDEEESDAITISLLNGTTQEGVTSSLADEIEEVAIEGVEFSVGSRKIASKTDYQKSTIYDVNGEYTEQMEGLANEFGFQYRTGTPESEDEVNTDFVIVIGKDYEAIQ